MDFLPKTSNDFRVLVGRNPSMFDRLRHGALSFERRTNLQARKNRRTAAFSLL
jgi:hypothetical protein